MGHGLWAEPWGMGCGPSAVGCRLNAVGHGPWAECRGPWAECRGPWAECLSLCASSQPPASPSTQEAIQGMLSMANLQASDSCLQTTWGAGQAKGSSLVAHGARKNGGGGKSAGKRLLKRAAKNSVDLDDYEEEQDHLDACFKDSDYGEPCGGAGGLWPAPWGLPAVPLGLVLVPTPGRSLGHGEVGLRKHVTRWRACRSHHPEGNPPRPLPRVSPSACIGSWVQAVLHGLFTAPHVPMSAAGRRLVASSSRPL